MTDAFWTAFFANMPAMIGAIGALIVSLIVALKQHDATKTINEIKEATNGMAKRLEGQARDAGHAQGMLDQRSATASQQTKSHM